MHSPVGKVEAMVKILHCDCGECLAFYEVLARLERAFGPITIVSDEHATIGADEQRAFAQAS